MPRRPLRLPAGLGRAAGKVLLPGVMMTFMSLLELASGRRLTAAVTALTGLPFLLIWAAGFLLPRLGLVTLVELEPDGGLPAPPPSLALPPAAPGEMRPADREPTAPDAFWKVPRGAGWVAVALPSFALCLWCFGLGSPSGQLMFGWSLGTVSVAGKAVDAWDLLGAAFLAAAAWAAGGGAWQVVRDLNRGED